jgi:murein DD-endopeptidase MepM/ murein hydrolase activator NlpD
VVAETFAWPAPGSLIQRYSEHHHSVDIANQLGTPVLAIAGGTVIQTEEEHELHGTYVLLDHGNGYRSFYSHLSLAHVQVGERVVQGQKIGRMGRTGLATGPHLHFEIRREGRQIDPLAEIPRGVWEKQLALDPGDSGSETEGYVWPLRGDLNQGYSISHPALDIGQHEGAPVRAMAAGRVTLAAEDAQNGIHVLLVHRDGLTSFYSHLSLAHVEGGEWVTKGQEIGLVGDTGVSTGPHLHLQVRRHGEPVNPLDLLPLPHWGE